MGNGQPKRSPFGRHIGAIPTDLLSVVALVLLVNFTVVAPVIRETPLRVPFVLAFVLFVPGYVTVAALYPKRADSIEREVTDGRESIVSARLHSQIGTIERVALSFSLSFVMVPAIGIPLIRWYDGVRLVPILVALTTVTLLLTVVAIGRRWNVPEDERFSVSFRAWIAAARSRILSHDSRVDVVLTVLLVASVLFAAGIAGFAVGNLPQEDVFSSITIEETNAGESDAVVVVDNHEHRSAEYTLVVVEQSLAPADVEQSIDEQRELDRIEFRLDHEETERLEYELEPTLTGEDVRIVWLLYVDDEPNDPSIEEAQYYVHLHIDDE